MASPAAIGSTYTTSNVCFPFSKPDQITESHAQIRDLVERIATALVDRPENVRVRSIEGSQTTVFELRTHPDDLGKVIGREGRIAKAVRTLLGASGMKLHRRFTLEIVDRPGSE